MRVRRLVLRRRESNSEVVFVLDPKLLDILVCPRCKGDLAYHAEPESLDCGACSLRFRIEDGIPIMLVDEAKPISEAANPISEDGDAP
jgi:uncharacterized protein